MTNYLKWIALVRGKTSLHSFRQNLMGKSYKILYEKHLLGDIISLCKKDDSTRKSFLQALSR